MTVFEPTITRSDTSAKHLRQSVKQAYVISEALWSVITVISNSARVEFANLLSKSERLAQIMTICQQSVHSVWYKLQDTSW